MQAQGLVSAASPWAWHPHPDVWLLIVLLAAGYVAALTLLGPRRAPRGGPPASVRQQVLYFGGVVALWIGADWPIHDLSEGYLFSVHMVQHMIFTFVAPPLLLLGLPAWLLRAMLRPRWIAATLRVVTRPLIAFLLFNGVIAITHWPLLVNLSLRSEPAHFAIHSVLVVSATVMWWPVVNPLP